MEDQYKPTKFHYSASKFEPDFGSKILVFLIRMTDSLWESGRSVILKSGFGYVTSVVHLKRWDCFLITPSRIITTDQITWRHKRQSMRYQVKIWEPSDHIKGIFLQKIKKLYRYNGRFNSQLLHANKLGYRQELGCSEKCYELAGNHSSLNMSKYKTGTTTALTKIGKDVSLLKLL